MLVSFAYGVARFRPEQRDKPVFAAVRMNSWGHGMRKKVYIILLVVLCIILFEVIASGFSIQPSAYITGDFVVFEDGSEMTFQAGVGSSMGFVRGDRDEGGGANPHRLKFYSAWGGFNRAIGAKNVYTLKLEPEDTEIDVYHGDRGYESALKKDGTSGEWDRVK